MAAFWSPALAEEPTQSSWVNSPTQVEWEAAIPEESKRTQLLRAVVRCAVDVSGELSGCRIIRETPTGLGVGKALLELAPKFRRRPPGEKDPRQVDIAIGWANIDKPGDWLKKPTPSELHAVFPTEAYKRGISGWAMIQCISTVQGALTDCVASDEFPTDMGFGGAAIALTPQFLLKPATLNGKPVSSIIRMPINFKLFGPMPVADSKRVAPPNLPWAEAPTHADVVAAYPNKARVQRVGGRATVACTMTSEGRLTRCESISSNPRGYGFDAAAKGLAKSFRLQVTTPADAAAARQIVVHLPVAFDPAMLEQGAPVIGKPSWASIPKADEILAVFQALKATSTVRVQLKCMVQPEGYVGQCEVASEQPGGLGAGAAALSLAPRFRLTTWTSEGLPTIGGTVTIPLRYEPEKAAVPLAAAAP